MVFFYRTVFSHTTVCIGRSPAEPCVKIRPRIIARISQPQTAVG